MILEKIVTLANAPTRLRFLAMERSLRAVGCSLPIWVIPYDDQRFELPANATWWDAPDFFAFLREHDAHPMMRKYLCLTTANYQFVDSDVIFLLDPVQILAHATGWVTSCGNWRDPSHTLTPELKRIMESRETMWQKRLFNAGQFAADRIIYDLPDLQKVANDERYRPVVLRFPFHDQPGLNMLVALSGVEVTNLTLPPRNMESTWAGDYPAGFESYWKADRKPYLIHWAGRGWSVARPIDRLYLQYYTREEAAEWQARGLARVKAASNWRARLGLVRSRLSKAVREFASILAVGQTLERRDSAGRETF